VWLLHASFNFVMILTRVAIVRDTVNPSNLIETTSTDQLLVFLILAHNEARQAGSIIEHNLPLYRVNLPF
jgi:hypothetical protein